MKISTVKFNLIRPAMLLAITCMLFTSGCARYARNVNTLYEPAATIRSGSGDIYIVIPESQQTRSPDIKWVLGDVRNDDNKKIDEILSPRSAAEILQAAFGLELKRAGYTNLPVSKRTGSEQNLIDLTKTVIELEQISDLADIKAKCRVTVGIDVIRKGQLIKRLEYTTASSKTDIKDRDMLVSAVLQDALQSVMIKAIPDLHALFNR